MAAFVLSLGRTVVDMPKTNSDIGAWARKRAEDIRAHSASPAEAARIMLLLADDRRGEAEILTERAETDLLRARTARDKSFDAAADELETHARFLDDRAKELMRESAALEALAMKSA